MTASFHRLLRRQISRHLELIGEDEPKWQVFFLAVSRAYEEFDNDKLMLDRSLELSSKELNELNDQLISQKDQLEKSLNQVKMMQDQIVLQEKLASMGALTAGIAHEIRNPLNFVTNFADLSAELIGEIRDLLPTNSTEDTIFELSEIFGLLESLDKNVRKIVEHGKRADSIVRNMLQHSSNRSGSFEWINLNELLDEFVMIAYHGNRAVNDQLTIGIEKLFDPEIGKVELVSQDLSRVVINMVNNAWYALAERLHQEGKSYRPVLSVTTISKGDLVEIHFKDNGTGILKENLSKIMEPFYTTKPTGQGTGLGLSLSFEIIKKKHHGMITVISEEKEFTEFVITLPRKQPKEISSL